MKCPKCKNEMIIKSNDVSHNAKNGKKYERTLYWCDVDDIWINIEIPKSDSMVSQ